MGVWLRFSILSIYIPLLCVALAPHPAFTYTLHAQKEPRGWSLVEIPAPPSTLLAVTPAGTLLVLIPQPERKWVLKQLISWTTPTPKELTLDIASDVERDGQSWITGDLIITKDGNYALIRIASHRASSDADILQVEASIILVDLRSFSIIYKRTTLDPLIARGQWYLANDDALISNAITKRSHAKSKSLLTVTDNYEAAALNFSDLKASASCAYTKVLEFRDGRSVYRTEEGKNVGDGCAKVVQAADVASIDDLPGGGALQKVAKTLNSSPNCGITGVSNSGRFALYQCAVSHETDWDTVKTTSHSMLVLSTTNNATVLSMALKIKQPTAASFATQDGQEYVLLLRDGINLEAYRLP
jgi:hypothetical protein